jgi:hypothetical protein
MWVTEAREGYVRDKQDGRKQCTHNLDVLVPARSAECVFLEIVPFHRHDLGGVFVPDLDGQSLQCPWSARATTLSAERSGGRKGSRQMCKEKLATRLEGDVEQPQTAITAPS